MKVEQIAFATDNPEKLIETLKTLGLTEWVQDYVVADGFVFGKETQNVAELNFNYQLGFELEILKYIGGSNWHEKRNNFEQSPVFQSHLGYHATGEQIDDMKAKMADIGIGIAQEVWTKAHTNPVINNKRKYHYVVFDSKQSLGFDLKLIERIMIGEDVDQSNSSHIAGADNYPLGSI